MDERIVLQILVRSLSPSQGGNNPRNLETTRKLQILQQAEISNVKKENSNLSTKDSPVYVRMTLHAHRIEEEKNGKEKKMERQHWKKIWIKKIKILVERLKMDYCWLSPQGFMVNQ